MAFFDVDRIRQLAALMRDLDLSELEIVEGQVQVQVRLKRAQESSVRRPSEQGLLPSPSLLGDSGSGSSAAPVAPAVSEVVRKSPTDQAGVLTAPMVGTVYMSPEPGSPPFVRVGDRVEADQAVLIIEAMKVMNTIQANRSGTVKEIMVGNHHAVEFGDPLMVIE